MEMDFFRDTKELRDEIKANVFDYFSKVENRQVRDIVL